MPRIDFKEARSIGIATIEDEEINRTDPRELGPWDICTSCWHDNQLKDDCEHLDYDHKGYVCLVCGKQLQGELDNHPTEENNETVILNPFLEGLKELFTMPTQESQPGAPLTELEEYCLKLDNDIKAFKITLEQNSRELERLRISNRVTAAAIEVTQEVLNEHRMKL